MSFMTVNGTGTGELAISIDTVNRILVEEAKLDCKSPGSYNVECDLKAVPDPECEQPPCEMWLPGTYNQYVTIGQYKTILPVIQDIIVTAVCYGECDSKHPHSAIYDEAHLSFEVTG